MFYSHLYFVGMYVDVGEHLVHYPLSKLNNGLSYEHFIHSSVSMFKYGLLGGQSTTFG